MLKSRLTKVFAAFAVVALVSSFTAPAEGASVSKRVTIHYHRFSGDYTGWNAYLWKYKQGGGAGYQFTGTDSFGAYGVFNIPNSTTAKQIGFYLRLNESDTRDDFAEARYISQFTKRGWSQIWIVQGDPTIYFEAPDVTPRLTSARIDSLNTITVTLNYPFLGLTTGSNGFTLDGPGDLNISSVVALGSTTTLTLTTSSNIDPSGSYTLKHDGYADIPLQIGNLLTSPSFTELYTYEGDDLGNTYSPSGTDFRVWAPTASEATLMVYATADASTATETAMTQDVNGTWVASLAGDQDGTIYTYKVKVGGVWREAVDPYVRSAIVNGGRGVVVNLESTDPANFRASTSPAFSGNASDAIFYELHVRDLSMDDSSGIPEQYKGKFLALTQAGTKASDGVTKTGIDAIVDLGVTHVQLLPIYDYNSVDETRNDQFNWGYDPLNYNVVEGSYSTDPENPKARINELKQTIQYMHSRGLRVIMDVVYNHVFDAGTHSFESLVPGYYFRQNIDGSFADGTGCGNEVASNHPMARKYIVDSVKYWASEFKLDGFRFDLMGILDVTTMQEVREALTEIDPTILIIGEGWNMGSSLEDSQKASQQNIGELPGIGMFNDGIRDAIKGSTFNGSEPGWATGSYGFKFNVMSGIVGNVNYGDGIGNNWGVMTPGQSVNYVEAHDNLTLYDKLLNSVSGKAARIKAFRMSNAIIMLAQGMPFIQAGQEFMRSKDNDENSYQSPDSTNSLKWDMRTKNAGMVNYFKGLIALRKAHPAFRLTTEEQVKNVLTFINTKSSVIAYTLDGAQAGDSWAKIVVIHNASTKPSTVSMPVQGNWKLVVDEARTGTTVLKMFKHATSVTVPANATYVLYR